MNFDVHNTNSYFLEDVDRTKAEELLRDNEIGTFLVRKSSVEGKLALSLKEPSKIGHYEIERRLSNNRAEYKIGNHSFPALADLLTFYKLHYVGEAPLVRPINFQEDDKDDKVEESTQLNMPKLARVVIPRVPNAYDPNQLHLEKDEIIEVLKTNVNGNWEGRRLSSGLVGTFPFNHVVFLEEEDLVTLS